MDRNRAGKTQLTSTRFCASLIEFQSSKTKNDVFIIGLRSRETYLKTCFTAFKDTSNEEIT